MSYYEIPVAVYRKNQGITSRVIKSSSELVPGDIFEIPEQKLMPCDAILLNGSCIMNESMLIGESLPILKSPIPRTSIKFNPKEDKQHILYAGTHSIQVRGGLDKPALAMVISTGFGTVKGDLIRSMLYPRSTDFEFYHDSFKFIIMLTILAIIGNYPDLDAYGYRNPY